MLSRFLVILCVVAALTTMVRAENEDDEVFIVACCATGDIPMGGVESACNQDFCDTVTNKQAAALKEFDKTLKTQDETATKDGFAASHQAGEGEDRSNQILQDAAALSGSAGPTISFPKYTATDHPAPASSFLEAQADIRTSKRLSQKISTAAAAQQQNVYNPATLHPAGVIKYKWGGNLAGSLTSMGAAPKAVLFWYTHAIKEWETNTCLWFQETSTAAVTMQDSTYGSSCSGIGTAARTVIVEQADPTTSRTRECAEHELGHLIGFDHTNKRSDAYHNPAVAGDYITFNTNACFNYYWTSICNRPAERGKTYVQNMCSTDAHKATVSAIHTQVRGTAWNYVPAAAGHRDYCEYFMCTYSWLYQYNKNPAYSDAGGYEYGSIMHYPFDTCIQKTVGKSDGLGDRNPGKNKITDNDLALVNTAYGCLDLTVNWATSKPAKTVKVHPKLPANQLPAYLAKKLGWKSSFTLKKTADGSAITGTGEIGNLGAVDLNPKFSV